MLSDDPADIVFGELYRLRDRDELLREFDMYEACGEGFAGADRICPADAAGDAADGAARRGVDLCLQLAGHRPAADRLGAVSGEVAFEAIRPAHAGGSDPGSGAPANATETAAL